MSKFWIAFVCVCTSLFAKGEFTISLSDRQICDLELLFNRGFAPLNGFMNRADYERVVQEMRLSDGTLWPIPIVLDVNEKMQQKIMPGACLDLCDMEGTVLAQMEVSEVWTPDKRKEAELVYGTLNRNHPGVSYLLERTGDYYVSGKLTQVSPIQHFEFMELRKTPEELKDHFKKNGYERVVGFQTRNPMHRAHFELTLRAAEKTGAHILLHPAVGVTKPGDVDYFTRVKCYQSLLGHYENGATLSLLPLAMRMAGPREALWHAIIRKNYGCTDFIVGRDHSGPGKDESGIDFYPPYAAQELVKAYAEEIGIGIVPSQEMVYVEEDDSYQPIDTIDLGKTILSISGTQLRKLLKEGSSIPEWFTFKEVEEVLRKTYPPRKEQGLTLFFTGLSAAGKSTLAKAVSSKLMEIQDRPITLLDGDIVRKYLSSELGFSKEHRSLNVKRVGFVSSQISKNRGIAICALIAPYEEDRQSNRNLIEESGSYIEIFVATSLEDCEKRDPKGLYALARNGKLRSFTGIDDPYEVPQNPEIVIDTAQCSIEEGVEQILGFLRQEGFI